MRSKEIDMEEAREARKLLNMPGGLELHIGVRYNPVREPVEPIRIANVMV